MSAKQLADIASLMTAICNGISDSPRFAEFVVSSDNDHKSGEIYIDGPNEERYRVKVEIG